MKIHPHDLLLLELAADPAAGTPRLCCHLAACEACRRRLHALAPSRCPPVDPGRFRGSALPDYGPALARSERLAESWRASFARERAAAPGLLAELLSHPAPRRRLLLGNSRRFRTWCLCELLVEGCRSTGPEVEEWTRLALHLAGLLDPAVYGRERIEDLTARAWSHLGDLRRRRGDLAAAARAFETAAGHLRSGTGEPLERALFLDLKAALRLDQSREAERLEPRQAERRRGEALRLLRRALAVFQEVGDDRRAGRSLIRQAEALEHQGRWAEAIPLREEAARRLAAPADHDLLLAALHGLLLDLVRTGRLLEAQRLLGRLRQFYGGIADPAVRSRGLWVEAQLARDLGQPERAEALLLAASGELLALPPGQARPDCSPDAASLVALDLAALYAEQGRAADLQRTVAALVPLCPWWPAA